MIAPKKIVFNRRDHLIAPLSSLCRIERSKGNRVDGLGRWQWDERSRTWQERREVGITALNDDMECQKPNLSGSLPASISHFSLWLLLARVQRGESFRCRMWLSVRT